VKADQVSPRLQEEFYRKSLMPSETKQ